MTDIQHDRVTINGVEYIRADQSVPAPNGNRAVVVSDHRIQIVIDHLRADGWEPSDDGSDEGSLERMATKLLEALDKPDPWRQLGEWLADRDSGTQRSWRLWNPTKDDPQFGVRLTDGITFKYGEGPTLDDALVNAMEKLK